MDNPTLNLYKQKIIKTSMIIGLMKQLKIYIYIFGIIFAIGILNFLNHC